MKEWNPLYDYPLGPNPEAKYSDFPLGSKVKVVCDMQDFHCFYGETGKVIKNDKRDIIVEFDTPRKLIGNERDVFGERCWRSNIFLQKTFNFKPSDLEKL